jgi:hypothetical protein
LIVYALDKFPKDLVISAEGKKKKLRRPLDEGMSLLFNITDWPRLVMMMMMMIKYATSTIHQIKNLLNVRE